MNERAGYVAGKALDGTGAGLGAVGRLEVLVTKKHRKAPAHSAPTTLIDVSMVRCARPLAVNGRDIRERWL